MTAPEPGWYSDPLAMGWLRVWDGAGWTQHIQRRMLRRRVCAECPMPRPGWYKGPNATDRLRIWDGIGWTEQTAPAPGRPSPRPRPAQRPRTVVASVIGVAAALIAVLGSSWPSADNPSAWRTVPAASRTPDRDISPRADDGTGGTVAYRTSGGPSAATPVGSIEAPPGTGPTGSGPAYPVAPTTTAPTATALNPLTLTPATAARSTPRTVAALRPAVAAITRRGTSADYSLSGYRWHRCQAVTVSSDGPDVTAIVAELAAITSIHLQIVSGPAQIMVSWGTIPIDNAIGEAVMFPQDGWLDHANVTINPRGAQYLPTLLRHELGHALGLGHAGQANEVMYPVLRPGSPIDYQDGDVAGLRAIGASAAKC